jgi:hypothetical protein
MIPPHRAGVSDRLLFAAAAAFLAAASAPAAGAPACNAVSSGKAADEIRALEEAGGQSNVKGMSLEDGKRMFASSFMSFGPDGAVKTRNDILKTYVDGRMAPWASSFAIKELQVKVYCGTATVIGLSEVRVKNAPPNAPPAHFRWLNVWARPEGFWQIVATQFTRLK